jgi:erythritol kinase
MRAVVPRSPVVNSTASQTWYGRVDQRMRDGAAVPQQNEVLIGLHVGTASIEAVAFAPDGHELAPAVVALPCREPGAGVVEQEVGETWRATVLALRRLAQAVPHLQARTVALAITGASHGTWLIDEDGDPVGPAWLAQDRRAEPVVARWRQSGVAARVQEISGRRLEPSLRSAQLAWLAQHQPGMLDGAVTAFAAKDCLYFFCTGERATDAATAVAAFGDWRTGAYDSRVLELLGLAQVSKLLPEIVDGTRHHGALTAAAAAASGLLASTPVVLAPVNTVTTALALGLGRRDPALGGTVLGASNLHMRVCADLALAATMAGQAAVLPFAPAGGWLGVLEQSGTINIEWLITAAEQLLRDAGLIGLPSHELSALLERRAAEAAPGAVSYRPYAGEGGAAFCGLSSRTTFYDLLRAIYEGLGDAARDGYAALGFRPCQVRVNAGAGAGPLAYACLAGCLDAPVFTTGRETPAAAGAALVAAVALGHYRDVIDGQREWVEPRLHEVEKVARKRAASVTRDSAATASGRLSRAGGRSAGN